VTTKSRLSQNEGLGRQHDRNLRALKLMIDNWRWAGVPFYLRTGRRSNPRTEVAIEFKRAPFAMFRDTPVDRLARNFLVMSIQPDECIGLQSTRKCQGPPSRFRA